ncbi:type II secretion system protein E, partial [Rhodopirellula maiorica SM1]
MRRLGDVLIEQHVISAESLDAAFASKPHGVLLGDWLVSQKLLSTIQLGRALAEQFAVPYIDIDATAVDAQIARLLPEDFARTRQSGAIKVEDRQLILAMVAPDDIETIAE